MLRELKKCQGCQKLLRSFKEITSFASFFQTMSPLHNNYRCFSLLNHFVESTKQSASSAQVPECSKALSV